MAKISLDVEEIKKNLKETALNAKSQLSELAKRAQKDLSQKEVLKKIDQVVEIVKSQEFLKNPKVAELAHRIVALSDQLEKSVTKNAHQFASQVRTTVNNATKSTAPKSAAKKATNGAASVKKNAENSETTEN